MTSSSPSPMSNCPVHSFTTCCFFSFQKKAVTGKKSKVSHIKRNNFQKRNPNQVTAASTTGKVKKKKIGLGKSAFKQGGSSKTKKLTKAQFAHQAAKAAAGIR